MECLFLVRLEKAPPTHPSFRFDEEGQTVGFCSCYRFLMFPDKRRLRISQFLVLPSHQRRGLGSLLYRQILQEASGEAIVGEITVEDPSETFSDFRLVNDAALVARGAQIKLAPLQLALVQLFLRSQSVSETEGEHFDQFRRDLKKHLLRRHAECQSAGREERLKLLDRLFNEELVRFKRISKV